MGELMLGIQRKWWLAVVTGVAAVTLSLAFRHWITNRWVDDSLKYAQALLNTGDASNARDLADEILARRPTVSRAAMIGAEACVKQEKFDEALQFLKIYIANDGDELDKAYGYQGAILLNQRKVEAAEEAFRKASKINPDNIRAKQQLCFILLCQGRRSESRPIRFGMLKHGDLLTEDLVFLGNPQAILSAADYLEGFLIEDPQFTVPHLGLGKLAEKSSQLVEAEKHYKAVIEKFPKQAESQARLGHVLLAKPAKEREALLKAWNDSLPESTFTHAEIWVVRGLWCQQRRDWDSAVRCFWEALKRDAIHTRASIQLSVSLGAVGDAEVAKAFQTQSNYLQELERISDQVHEHGGTLRGMARAAELAEKLGRYWEAEGWARVALSYEAESNVDGNEENRQAVTRENQKAHALAEKVRQRVSMKLGSDLPQIAPEFLIAEKTDLSRYPIPQFRNLVEPVAYVVGEILQRTPRFGEVTKNAGIDFQYFAGEDLNTEGRRMFELTGGGVAIIDFDQDGWPDIYLTQGSEWPPSPSATKYNDRLYKNRGDGTFVDVTQRAGLNDLRFGQGVASGDFNNDGWPDLFVANIGQNRLFRNNGDGTFVDVAIDGGLKGELWSTSVAIADLNGDGIPDLYEVNYLKRGRVFDMICIIEGRARACSPTEFDAEQDRVFFGDGKGAFRETTAESGIVADRGKGLGCLVADFQGNGNLGVFVSNDTTANFMFMAKQPLADEPTFSEQALLLGTAFDREGLAQACMGIAADDADADGKIDLFVTNFYEESNAFYHQQTEGVFLEQASGWGLKKGSMKLLGFGTQFLDAELDGLPDLVIANGHVDDLVHVGAAFHMRPQYYRNIGGRFVERLGADVGDYFQRKLLGRGLALIDYNRDGKEDFVVSHLDQPVSLIENQSENAGHYLAVKIVAKSSARDGVGTSVTVINGESKRIRQVTAGSGYQASNEAQLIFGLGSHKQVERIEVRWPNGKTETYAGIKSDQKISIIEGAGYFSLPLENQRAENIDETGSSSPAQ